MWPQAAILQLLDLVDSASKENRVMLVSQYWILSSGRAVLDTGDRCTMERDNKASVHLPSGQLGSVSCLQPNFPAVPCSSTPVPLAQPKGTQRLSFSFSHRDCGPPKEGNHCELGKCIWEKRNQIVKHMKGGEGVIGGNKGKFVRN